MNLIKLKKLANARQFKELEALWPEALVDEEIEREELAPIIGQVRRLGEPDRADVLMETYCEAVEAADGRPARLDAARGCAEHLPASEKLRTELKRLYKAIHGDYDALPALLDALMPAGTRLPEAVTQIDRYLRLRPGAFLSDRGHLEPGTVVEVKPAAAELVVSFSGRHETLGPEAVSQVIILPPEHFPSLLLYRADELRALAHEDPEAFVIKQLASTRDRACAYRELRKSVVALEGESAWSGWWKKARPVLKKSTRLDVGGGSQPGFRILAQERSYEERVREQFRGLEDPRARLEFVLDHLVSARKEKDADTELLAEMGDAAARQAGKLLESDPMLTLACLAVHHAVAAQGVEVVKMNPKAAAAVLARVKDPSLLPTHLSDRLLQAVLEFVHVTLPEEWTRIWGLILPRTGRMVCDHMARELLAADQIDVLAEALIRVLAHPTASPDVLCWLWRARLNETRTAEILNAMPGLGFGEVLEAMLELMDATGRMTALSDDKRLRKIIEQAQETMALQEGLPIRAHIDALDKDGARTLKDRVEAATGLPPSTRTTVLTHLRGAHPEIFVESAKPWEEDVYYTTESGLTRRQGELDHLVQDALPAVAKQIGEAAAHGDLSENAEYTAALEKRDQITSNATRIESELAKAKVIEPEMTRTAFVNIGTRVTLRDLDTGRETAYAFLGVWDSDPDNGVLSYKAPLAMAFMGHVPGDVVEYGDEGDRKSWEVVGVEPAVLRGWGSHLHVEDLSQQGRRTGISAC